MLTRPVEVTDSGHLIELLYDDGERADLLFCAGHGGAVEPGTSEAAVELATAREEAVCWATFGEEMDGPAFDEWHPPSKAIDTDQYRLLGRIADRGFETVLSLHGLAGDEILVGGGVPTDRKETVVAYLDDAVSIPVSVATRTQYAGEHPGNFVNWLAEEGGGIQLELGPTARGPECAQVREAIHDLLDDGPLTG
jgi:phage replication-related protein YjqB (UPF0714/DUF867 family)